MYKNQSEDENRSLLFPAHISQTIREYFQDCTFEICKFHGSPTFLALSRKSRRSFSNSSYDNVPVFHMHKIPLACLQKSTDDRPLHQVRYVTGVLQGTGNDFTLFSCRVGRVKKILGLLVIFGGGGKSRSRSIKLVLLEAGVSLT